MLRNTKPRGANMSTQIQQILSSLFKSEITSEQAASELQAHCSPEEVAEYLIDAFNRGWITPFNVGLDSDGNIQ